MVFRERFGDAALTPEFCEWMMGYEEQFTKLIPTPIASDCYGGNHKKMKDFGLQTVQVEREAGPSLRREIKHSRGGDSAWQNWPDEPNVDRVAYGIPHRVDRLKCLGNAVVPQQFYPFFAAIAEIERSGAE